MLPTLHQTRQLARLEFAGVTGRLIGSPGDGAAVLDRALDVAAVALAAEQLGGAQRALDMAVEYAKVRCDLPVQLVTDERRVVKGPTARP